ncbi:hypothetical protein BDR26DRAFT_660923 [Obelidium mucronatum]|nr:hypothetical protein BDR26DRAFT_660923 [Obelidium mucronatum]
MATEGAREEEVDLRDSACFCIMFSLSFFATWMLMAGSWRSVAKFKACIFVRKLVLVVFFWFFSFLAVYRSFYK